MRLLLGAWHTTPAYVQGPFQDVLAANRLAVTLSPIFTPGSNILRSVLLDPGVQEFVPGWRDRAGSLVAALRVMAGPGGGVHHLRHPLVGDLELHYEKFAVTAAQGQLLVVYRAAPGSPSADALALRGALPEPARSSESTVRA